MNFKMVHSASSSGIDICEWDGKVCSRATRGPALHCSFYCIRRLVPPRTEIGFALSTVGVAWILIVLTLKQFFESIVENVE